MAGRGGPSSPHLVLSSGAGSTRPGGTHISVLAFTIILLAGSSAAGLMGSLTGLGGGIVIVPLLTVGFGVDIRYAIGASLVAIIAVSSGSAASYVKRGYTNIRVGMLLEVGTVLGALVGAGLVSHIPGRVLQVAFGVVLIYSVFLTLREARRATSMVETGPPDPLAVRLRLDSTFPADDGSLVAYRVRHIPGALGVMAVAGVISSLLGIGSGAIKVLAMDQLMRLPFKVSTTTSNFMIGVTAAASSGIYLHRGYVDVRIAAPVMLGALLGSTVGARLLTRLGSKTLRLIFAAVILILGLTMIGKGLGL
jgi:uncharacterized membrane protein YfcA